ncbi:GNAT family N-acetyltransferase [Tersicoccus sp. MR15.9]|uniref:GNAT family N-acetyltransferase n=1 Tax=Tersicoccus mangrovi TaxID=3121635 RepID=UPI002FE5095A
MDDTGAMMIRHAEPEDLPSVGTLLRGGSLDSVEKALTDPDRVVLVATSADGEVVGWAKTHRWCDDDPPAPAGHYLGGVTVAEDWRRRGIGTALTLRRMAWVRERANVAWCVVNARNTASLALHRALGFVEAARGPRFHTTTFDGGLGILLRAGDADRYADAVTTSRAADQPSAARPSPTGPSRPEVGTGP